MEQKYVNVPALLSVVENFSSVSSTFDLNSLSVLTTVCGMSSWFVHVIVVPTLTVTSAGPKVKLSIFTSVGGAGGCAATLPAMAPRAAIAIAHAARNTPVDTLLLICCLPFVKSLEAESDVVLNQASDESTIASGCFPLR